MLFYDYHCLSKLVSLFKILSTCDQKQFSADYLRDDIQMLLKGRKHQILCSGLRKTRFLTNHQRWVTAILKIAPLPLTLLVECNSDATVIATESKISSELSLPLFSVHI